MSELLAATSAAVDDFAAAFAATAQLRRRAQRKLARMTRRDNVCFDGLARVSHVTDATDWRVEYPFVVLYPDHEDEVAALVRACIELGLTIIPRGGGTGYTGGAVPLSRNCAVINTEKLDTLGGVERMRLTVSDQHCAHHRLRRGCGDAPGDGGGRGAGPGLRSRSDVRGCILHWRQHRHERRRQEGGPVGHGPGQSGVVANGRCERVLYGGRAAGPQPRQDPRCSAGALLGSALSPGRQDAVRPGRRFSRFPGARFRKAGLGKDVTDKFLAGLPGVQKEGCDGIITSARFMLHRMPAHIRTVCLEFFGQVREGVPSIVEIKRYLDESPPAQRWPVSSIWTSAM